MIEITDASMIPGMFRVMECKCILNIKKQIVFRREI